MTNPAGYVTGCICPLCTGYPVAQRDVLLINPSSSVAGYATGYPDVQPDTLLYNQLSRCPGAQHIRTPCCALLPADLSDCDGIGQIARCLCKSIEIAMIIFNNYHGRFYVTCSLAIIIMGRFYMTCTLI